MHEQYHFLLRYSVDLFDQTLEIQEDDSPGESEGFTTALSRQGRHHIPGEVESSITTMMKAGAVLQPWPPTAQQSAWAYLLHIKKESLSSQVLHCDRYKVEFGMVTCNWEVGSGMHLLPTFTFHGSRKPGKRGRHRGLLNLCNIRRVALHGKHNCSSPVPSS